MIHSCAHCDTQFESVKSFAKFCSKRCGEAFRRNLRWATCQYEKCGKQFHPHHRTAEKYCSRSCAQFDMKSGRWKDSHGYVRVRLPEGGHDLEHRVIMSKMLGRPMLAGEQVHHKNGIKDDNRPENLELWLKNQPTGIRASDYHCPGCNCKEQNP